MRIRVDHNLGAVISAIKKEVDRANSGLVKAINVTAREVGQAEKDEMRRVFDRPTPWALNGVRVRGATAQQIEALIWLKDDWATSSGIPAERFLRPNIYGGPRHIKRFEQALQMGGYMPRGWFAVPGRFARLDAYGNLSRGQIIQILSQLRLTLTAGYNRNISTDRKKRDQAIKRAGGQYFAITARRGKLVPGIYQRRDFTMGSAAPRPVVIFVSSAQYRRLFDFFGVAKRTVAARFDANFKAATA